jgi:hypothetical protein
MAGTSLDKSGHDSEECFEMIGTCPYDSFGSSSAKTSGR